MNKSVFLFEFIARMHLTQMMIVDVLPLFLHFALFLIFNLANGIVYFITCFCLWFLVYVCGRFTVSLCHFSVWWGRGAWDISCTHIII